MVAAAWFSCTHISNHAQRSRPTHLLWPGRRRRPSSTGSCPGSGSSGWPAGRPWTAGRAQWQGHRGSICVGYMCHGVEGLGAGERGITVSVQHKRPGQGLQHTRLLLRAQAARLPAWRHSSAGLPALEIRASTEHAPTLLAATQLAAKCLGATCQEAYALEIYT